METLAVGSISINQDGIILNVDRWTEQLLGYERGKLRGKHIGTVFSDNGETFIAIVRTKGPGYIGKKRIKLRSGVEQPVKVAMTPGIETHISTLQIVFAP